MEVWHQLHALATESLKIGPLVPFAGGWVGPRAALDTLDKTKVSWGVLGV